MKERLFLFDQRYMRHTIKYVLGSGSNFQNILILASKLSSLFSSLISLQFLSLKRFKKILDYLLTSL